MAENWTPDVNNLQQARISFKLQSRIDITYLLELYEVLMSSIGRVGTVRNCRINISMLIQIVQDHWLTNPCLQNFSEDYAGDRARFFGPIFETSFSWEGLCAVYDVGCFFFLKASFIF